MGLDVAQILGRHSTAQYREALLALLPPGKIWDEERSNAKGELYRLCQIWAAEYAELEGLLYSLHSETSPLNAKELKPWAAAAGITLFKGRELARRIKILVSLIGSQASTDNGLKKIAKNSWLSNGLEASGQNYRTLGPSAL